MAFAITDASIPGLRIETWGTRQVGDFGGWIPQGLKPLLLFAFYGTAEAVPLRILAVTTIAFGIDAFIPDLRIETWGTRPFTRD